MVNKTPYDMVKEAMALYRHPVHGPLTKESLEFRFKLVEEEFGELRQEVFPKDSVYDLVNMTKELADIMYVVIGMAHTFGLPLEDAFKEVHKSNMSKVADNGEIKYREDGKVLKGPNYEKPDIGKYFLGL